MSKQIAILDHLGKPLKANGHAKPRGQLIAAFNSANGLPVRRAAATYDAARDSDEYRRYWANSDALDADSSNSKAVRHKLLKRSRYEQGSNGYYAGILKTHVNMVVGVGPKLRMLTKNRTFNQLIEREFGLWAQQVGFRSKIWTMAHAKTQDGETFAIMQTNLALHGRVQLDFLPIEAEQCQSPMPRALKAGEVDGIHFDPDTNELLWYEVLPYHPGGEFQSLNRKDAIQVAARDMLHWFKSMRPGSHRGIPPLTSTLNLGAAFRRFREANLSTAEKVAAWTLFLKTMFQPDELDSIDAMSTLEIMHNMMTALPNSMEPFQLKAEHPSAEYKDFHRTLISEQASPIGQPYNVASHDSSTYSFASGKLDTLCYRAEIDVEREDCNDAVLDPLFGMWFREWRMVADEEDVGPVHQWDWPAHPVIDAEAESRATDTQLTNGSTTLREVYSNRGKDLEDELVVMAEDYFGEATEENIEKVRKINILRNTPEKSLPYVAQIIGVELAVPDAPDAPAQSAAAASGERAAMLNFLTENAAGKQPSVIVNVPEQQAAQISMVSVPAPPADVVVNVPQQSPQHVTVNIPEQAPAQVNITGSAAPPPDVNITMPALPQQNISVNVPEQIPAQVTISAAPIAAPDVNIVMPAAPQQSIVVNVPEQAAPQVHIAAAEAPPPNVNVTLPPLPQQQINVNVPQQEPPQINVMPATQAAPDVIVNVPEYPAPTVEVNVPQQPAPNVVVNVPKVDEFDIEPVRDPKTGLIKKYKRTKK